MGQRRRRRTSGIVPVRDAVVDAGGIAAGSVPRRRGARPRCPRTVPIAPVPAGHGRARGRWSRRLIGLAVWLLGSTVMGLRLWVGQRRMSRLRASAVPAEPDVEAICRDLAGRMRLRAPAVLRSPFLFSPCLDGLRRPAILLPDDVVDNLRETFVHELAHLARRDGLWNLLRRLAVAALWVQPLALGALAPSGGDGRGGLRRLRRAVRRRPRPLRRPPPGAGRPRLPPASPTGVGMVSLRSLLARRVVRILDSSRAPLDPGRHAGRHRHARRRARRHAAGGAARRRRAKANGAGSDRGKREDENRRGKDRPAPERIQPKRGGREAEARPGSRLRRIAQGPASRPGRRTVDRCHCLRAVPRGDRLR